MRKILLGLAISGLLWTVACGGGGGSNNSNNNNNNNSNNNNSTSSGAVAECIQFLDNSYLWGSVRLADVRVGGTTLSGTAVNVAPLTVDAGPVPTTNPQTNVAFTTVQVCAPGTSNCVTIDHVAVDTGSTGLRIPVSLLSSLNLPNVYSNSTPTSTGGTSEGSEFAGSVPIMVMGDTSIPSAPSTCSTVASSSTAGTAENTVATLGANGLIGVGNYQYDCDVPGNPIFNSSGVMTGTFGTGSSNACSPSGGNSTPPPATYYTCSSSGCTPALVSGPQQVQNPVSLFTDNNGVILSFPTPVPTIGSGAATASGSLVFGIGTQSNNGLGTATVLPIDTTYVDDAWLGITTKFNNVYYPPLGIYTSTGYPGTGSFFDSGSNAIYFLDTPTSGIADCLSNSIAGDYFYCPATSPDNLTATNLAVSNGAANGATAAAPFTVSSASTLFNANGGNNTAFSDLAGPNTPGTSSSNELPDAYFDWGLPFFYGKSVYTAIWKVTPPSGVPAGPFWAY